MVLVCSLASVAMAQSVPPAPSNASDSWATHPAGASTSYGNGHATMDPKQDKQHFKFKDRNDQGPVSAPPPGANDKAAVMGQDRAWQDGRPPVDCAQTPQDSKCH
jgi:hypothetical protein